MDRIANEFNLYQRALGLRQQRQEVLAANIANADTPHYKARDLDFSAELRGAMRQGRLPPVALTLSSPRHIPAQAPSAGNAALRYRQPLQPALDGNTVDMNVERTQFADNTMRYQADLSLISQHLKTLNAALQP